MAPNSQISTQLRQLIYYQLDCNLLDNALLFAGRLHAHDPRSPEAVYLLGLCHFRVGNIKAAYDSCRSSASRGTHLASVYLFAQACLGLQRYGEGAAALEQCRSIWIASSWGEIMFYYLLMLEAFSADLLILTIMLITDMHTESHRLLHPDAAAVCCLQGKLWQAHGDYQRATQSYTEALKANPFMWDAFTALCDLGAHVRVANVFKMTPEMLDMLSSTDAATLEDSPSPQTKPAIIHPDPFVAPPKSRPKSQLGLFDRISSNKNLPLATDADGDTPTARGRGPLNHSQSASHLEAPRRPRSRPQLLSDDLPTRSLSDFKRLGGERSDLRRIAEELPHRSLMADSAGNVLKRSISGHAMAEDKAEDLSKRISGGPQRKSVRLLNQLRPQASQGLKTDREVRKAKAPSVKGRTGTVGRVVSGNRMPTIDSMDVDEKKHTRPAVARVSITEKKSIEAVQWLLDLLVRLGTGYFALSHYHCQDAIRIFQSIVPNQRDTPWVLAQIGRAYFEQASYAEAEKIFACIRAVVPSQQESMEFYSSTLWHRKNEVDLAYLAHELVDLNRHSPQAWCAVGNSFSLQRDHDQAIKCFKRATQLQPSFAYAYTLQGHEHLANEEYDKSLAAFRAAVGAEKRHYNAWYGLGRVLEKQGKYRQAEDHYRTAATINPTNAILLTCVGVVLEKQNNPRAALVKYSEACLLAEKNTLPRFKKAKVLMTLGRPQSALAELLVLKDLCPDEANVHFTLGTVYKLLRQKGEAVRHFTMALNLDPRASHFIKEAMEQLQDVEDEED